MQIKYVLSSLGQTYRCHVVISEKDDMDSSSSVDFYSFFLFYLVKCNMIMSEIDEELKIYAKGTYEEMANITCR